MVYERVLSDMAHTYGYEYTADLRLKLLGRGEPDVAKIFLAGLGLEKKVTLEIFVKEYKERGRKALPGVNLLPGAERLVTHLYSKNIPFAIATSSAEEMVEIKTAHLKDLFNLFHHKVNIFNYSNLV